ncbi:hypothetical protein ACWGN5_07680 [Streptomyces sp. NPDC055815]
MIEYVRASGPYVAERVRPVPGSPEAEAYAALAADPGSGWRAVAVEPPALVAPSAPEPPAKSATKAEWVAYAITLGADEGGAEQATKDTLITTYGGDSATDQ